MKPFPSHSQASAALRAEYGRTEPVLRDVQSPKSLVSPVARAGGLGRVTAALARPIAITATGISVSLGIVGHAFAANGGSGGGVAGTPSGGIGAQLNTLSGEAASAGGTAFSMACYLGAAVCFFFGVWAAWQSRQPQNRETGYIGRAAAGLVLCGLFATAGVWINKAATSASGGSATITGNPQMVQFGTGG